MSIHVQQGEEGAHDKQRAEMTHEIIPGMVITPNNVTHDTIAVK